MKKKWTIIFLIYSELSASRRNERELFEKSNLTISSDDDSVRKELKSLFNDILSTPISKDVSVLVIYNRILLNSQETDQDVTFLLEVRESATPLNTIEFGIIDRCVVDDVTLKARSMTLVFYKIYKMYDSDRRLLFTWDHGSIFGIFRETVGYSITQNISYHKPWNKFQPQKNIGDILTSDELADAIQSGFNGKKIDILIMMNCYMQNIHTQYSLQKSVELLIAPESIISMPGYDYRAILSGIINNPDIYPGEVVKSVILSL
ncbi:MAG TPA: clostripain-related cysteine peptidase, partial [Chitinophagaceae bacterium]